MAKGIQLDNYKKCLKWTDHKFQGQYNIPDLPVSSGLDSFSSP